MIVSIALALAAQPSPARRTPVVEVVERAGPAVVNIGAEIVDIGSPFRRRSPFDDIWREFYREPPPVQQRRSESLGSGVIIDPSGLVLTNEHVISRASSIQVTLRDRRTYDVDVVGADPNFDIAVLRIRGAKDLPVVGLGTSADLMPGETLIAIGNPFGLSNTVTTGVVSALHRSIRAEDRSYEDFIQTDAAINPGNSGGALLNIEGRLIGINTAIHSGGTGIGFAIPIDKAMAVVEEVLRYGEVRPVYIGCQVDPRSQRGAMLRKVDEGGPMAEAGLRAGDRVVDVGGQQINDPRDFHGVMRGMIPNTKKSIGWMRGAERMNGTLTVRELTGDKAAEMGRLAIGLAVEESRAGHLIVTSVSRSSDAARVGIRRGDQLLSVAGRPMRGAADFASICAAIRNAEAVAVIIGRGGHRYYVTLRLG